MPDLRRPRPSNDHLSESEWEQLACGELSDRERDRVLDHVTACDECTAIHRGLIALAEGAAGFDAAAPRMSRPSAGNRWMYMAGLAAAAAVVAAVIVGRPFSSGERDVTRATLETITIETTAPAANAALAGRRFAWRAVSGAESYEIRINDANGGPVWTARSTAAEIAIPADVKLAAGAYFWQVSAFRESVTLGSSAIVAFRVE